MIVILPEPALAAGAACGLGSLTGLRPDPGEIVPDEFDFSGLDVPLDDLWRHHTGELSTAGSLEVRELVQRDRRIGLAEEVRAWMGPAVGKRDGDGRGRRAGRCGW